jgi:formylglycine-generating enzyme required for sulfatase activity
MRNLLLILLTILTTANSNSQRNPTKLSGTVIIDTNISMKQTEVTIQEWMSFIANNNFNAALFPDSNKISTTAKFLFNDLRRTKGFQYLKISDNSRLKRRLFGAKYVEGSKGFKDIIKNDTNYFSLTIPVTGVTYNQAVMFCQWKEDHINASQATKIKVSLPSVDIYKRVITNKDSLNDKKCAQFNSIHCKCVRETKKELEKLQGTTLVRADSYWPTALGLFNLQGNAAEMTNIQGVAMGGSFRHYAIESYSDRMQQYSSAEDWLGFRYIVTLL